MNLERLSLDEWDDALPERGIEPFHDGAALSVLDAHTAGDLYLVGGFKGDQPVGLLPLFVRSSPVGRTVTSPPPGMGVPRLGPVITPSSPKQRKREQVHRQFVDLVVDKFDLDDPATLFRMGCRPEYTDPRPFVWDEFDVGTRFTYRLEVGDSDPEDLLADTSKSLRREIRDANDLDVEICREGRIAVRRIFEQTRDRYEEQGESFTVDWSYLRDLYDALDDMVRAYVARDSDGHFLTGITVFFSPDAAYFWQGGNRHIYDGVAINSRVHWAIVEDIARNPPCEGVHTYDLFGANTERLCQYKSKFGAELVPYYEIDSGGARMAVAERMYGLLQSVTG